MPLNFGKITNDSILKSQVFIVSHTLVDRKIFPGLMRSPHCYSVSMFWWYRLRHGWKFFLEEGIIRWVCIALSHSSAL